MPIQEDNFITIRLVSEESSDETDLKKYLEDSLEAKVRQQFQESHWSPVILVVTPALVPVVKYAGRKLTDLLVDLLRDWIKKKPEVSEVVLYDADGNEIKIPRK